MWLALFEAGYSCDLRFSGLMCYPFVWSLEALLSRLWVDLIGVGAQGMFLGAFIHWLPFPRCVGLAGALVSLLPKRFANLEGCSYLFAWRRCLHRGGILFVCCSKTQNIKRESWLHFRDLRFRGMSTRMLHFHNLLALPLGFFHDYPFCHAVILH